MPTFEFNENNRYYSIVDYENEKWKLLDNININSKYYISNYGRVKADTDKGIRIMKPYKANGYYRVHILYKMYFIHRLVAIYFIDNPNNYEQVNHKDFNKLNNKVENLEWVSAKENSQYNYNCKILQYDLNTKEVIASYNSTGDAAKSVNGDRGRIAACCNNKYGCKSHCGFGWKYSNINKSYGNGKSKIIHQIDANDNIINTFNSLNEAAKYFNVGKTAIHNVLKGYAKYCKGYRFIYDN